MVKWDVLRSCMNIMMNVITAPANIQADIYHQKALVHKLHGFELWSKNVIRFYNEMWENNDLFNKTGLGLQCQTEQESFKDIVSQLCILRNNSTKLYLFVSLGWYIFCAFNMQLSLGNVDYSVPLKMI